MNSDNQLMVGVVMMLIGGCVALLAFTILREQQKGSKEKLDGENEDAVDADQEPQEEAEERIPWTLQRVKDWIQSLGREQETEEPVELIEPDEPVETEEPSEPLDDSREAFADVAPAAEQIVSEGEKIDIMTLLRDDTTGALIVQVGKHEYQAPNDLFDSPDWTRVRDAATDLSTRLSRVEAPDIEIEVKPSLDLTSKPKSMVDQINHILQTKLYEARITKTIKLHEGPDGSVRVRIEANSYAIDEVPDPEAKRLIREAVAEWEALY